MTSFLESAFFEFYFRSFIVGWLLIGLFSLFHWLWRKFISPPKSVEEILRELLKDDDNER